MSVLWHEWALPRQVPRWHTNLRTVKPAENPMNNQPFYQPAYSKPKIIKGCPNAEKDTPFKPGRNCWPQYILRDVNAENKKKSLFNAFEARLHKMAGASNHILHICACSRVCGRASIKLSPQSPPRETCSHTTRYNSPDHYLIKGATLFTWSQIKCA